MFRAVSLLARRDREILLCVNHVQDEDQRLLQLVSEYSPQCSKDWEVLSDMLSRYCSRGTSAQSRYHLLEQGGYTADGSLLGGSEQRSRGGEPWTAEEDQQLLDLVGESWLSNCLGADMLMACLILACRLTGCSQLQMLSGPTCLGVSNAGIRRATVSGAAIKS